MSRTGAMIEQFGEPAAALRRELERRNAEILTEYVANCEMIGKLAGVELALGCGPNLRPKDNPASRAAPTVLPLVRTGPRSAAVVDMSIPEFARDADPRD